MPTVLLAEDADLCRFPYATFLRRGGFDVCTAGDGDDALRVLRDRAADVVVLDLAMPRTDGTAVLRAMRADPRWRDTPVVVISALSERDVQRRVAGLGVRASLLKSRFTGRDLVRAVSECLAPAGSVEPSPTAAGDSR